MHEKVCPRFSLLVYHVCIVISLLHVLKLPPPVSVCWWLLCETTTQMFREMINRALDYKQNPSDFMDEVLQELEVQCLFFSFVCSFTCDLIFAHSAVCHAVRLSCRTLTWRRREMSQKGRRMDWKQKVLNSHEARDPPSWSSSGGWTETGAAVEKLKSDITCPRLSLMDAVSGQHCVTVTDASGLGFCFVPTSLYQVVRRSGWCPQYISR